MVTSALRLKRCRPLRVERDDVLLFFTSRTVEERFWLHPLLSCAPKNRNRRARRKCAHLERRALKRYDKLAAQANARSGPYARKFKWPPSDAGQSREKHSPGAVPRATPSRRLTSAIELGRRHAPFASIYNLPWKQPRACLHLQLALEAAAVNGARSTGVPGCAEQHSGSTRRERRELPAQQAFTPPGPGPLPAPPSSITGALWGQVNSSSTPPSGLSRSATSPPRNLPLPELPLPVSLPSPSVASLPLPGSAVPSVFAARLVESAGDQGLEAVRKRLSASPATVAPVDDGDDGDDGDDRDDVGDENASNGSSASEWLKRAVRLPAVPSAALLTPGAALLGGRFVVERQLGRGGMGVVYLARDTERGEHVALKTLPDSRPEAVYRMKQEFRSLADVAHPNLVRLHGLFEDSGRWFFTMERVEGEPFLDAGLQAGTQASTQVSTERSAKLEPLFGQLVAGIEAIHQAGKLHRDLKPSNVLCTPNGRVVILDFGLAVGPEPGGVGQTIADGAVSGTPAYMAPEQAAGKPASAASDWYALGVMLYEALSGNRPFEGSSGEVLAAKQLGEPAPLERTGTLPTLCMALLSRDPAARPGHAEIAAHFASHALGPADAAGDAPATTAEGLPFIGREQELRVLRTAYRTTDAGKPVRLFVGGVSGVGKSALLDRFLSELGQYDEAVIFAGRCYEREAVPYNAFDRVVDALSRHLRQLPEPEAMALLPASVAALGRIFPAIGRLALLSSVRRRGALPEGPDALRKLGLAALRELLARLSLSRPVVIYIDDLQWADADSARLMAELLAPPEPPAVLLLGTFRSDEVQQSAFFELLAKLDQAEPLLQRETLELPALPAGDARTLAAALGAEASTIDAIAAEAGGHPLFVRALCRNAGRGGAIGLDAMIERDVAELDTPSGRLLALLSLHGRPLVRATLLDAAGQSLLPADGHAMLDVLIERGLLRSTANDAAASVACYHDRLREVVVAGLDDQRRARLHGALARALEAAPRPDPEALVEHLLGAGKPLRAAQYAARAADEARAALAVKLAERLYAVALQHGQFEPAERRRLLVARANILLRSLNPDAGALFEQAAALAEGAQAEIDALTATLILARTDAAGVEQANVRLERVAAGLGLQPIWSDVAQAAERLSARGLEFEPQSEHALGPEALHRARMIELMGHAVLGSPERQAAAALQRLSLQLDLGWVPGILAAAAEVLQRGAMLAPNHPMTAAVFQWLERNAHRADAPDHALSVGRARAEVHAYVLGRPRVAADILEDGLARWEERPDGRLGHLRLFARERLLSQWELSGQYHKQQRAIAWARDAAELGATRQADAFQVRVVLHLLCVDQLAAARRMIDDVHARLPDDFHYPMWMRLWTRAFMGDGAGHLACYLEDLARVDMNTTSAFDRVWWTLHGVGAHSQRAAQLPPGDARDALLRAAASGLEAAQALEPVVGARAFVYAEGWLGLARGVHANALGRPEQALVELQRVAIVREPDVVPLPHHLALRALGKLEGGERGAEKIEQADGRMRENGHLQPERWFDALCPGFG